MIDSPPKNGKNIVFFFFNLYSFPCVIKKRNKIKRGIFFIFFISKENLLNESNYQGLYLDGNIKKSYNNQQNLTKYNRDDRVILPSSQTKLVEGSSSTPS